MRPLAFTGHGLDRADHFRVDPAKLAELRQRDDALLVALDGLTPKIEDDTLVLSGMADLPDDAELVFMGLRDEAPVFARVAGKGDGRPAYEQRINILALSRLSGPDLALFGGARSLIDWHARHRFCANCGQPTQIAKGGWQRDCPACEAQHFPRTDPVSIMLVEHDGDLLLGRNARYPAGSYSALAGFIEPGESIEEAVSREVLEEAGVTVRDVSYLASQPWPFPSQLMIGCHGHANSRELAVDYTELEDARWFSRDEVAEAMARGRESQSFIPPPPSAIAHYMLHWWLERTS
ncbi:NAD(+) diphosphatase [Aurantiacibacter sp. MUD11]|uniref:NAD(+) diphosphatase n=1 Tax=Aurantiacibacter sp. MUD11 TaxID=3003265 RepID=UPI0022AA78A6|nr:NAD(+) diphosphatase [Aurantiacibacter sp. MUD11]WAT17866.1 NAD(+) diphosphatase [Aurantiacibacter sp. MUD11]